MFSCSVASTAV